MKILKSLIGFGCVLSMVLVGSFAAKTACVNCGTGTSECQRVVVGTTTHIFYGKSSPCDKIKLICCCNTESWRHVIT